MNVLFGINVLTYKFDKENVMNRLIMAIVILFSFGSPFASECEITINGNDMMQYDVNTINVDNGLAPSGVLQQEEILTAMVYRIWPLDHRDRTKGVYMQGPSGL